MRSTVKTETFEHNFFTMLSLKVNSRNSSEIISFLSSRDRVSDFIYSLQPTQTEIRYIEEFCHHLSCFIQNNEDLIRGYLNFQRGINDLQFSFMRLLFKYKKLFDVDLYYAENALLLQDLNKYVFEAARKKQRCQNNSINIMGFGIGDGAYENQIARFISENYVNTKCNIIGYDPSCEVENNNVYTNLNQLLDEESLSFDLLISRWVLHHVKVEHRWHEFVSCLNKIERGGSAIIVEEAILFHECTALERQVYFLLHALFDVFINVGLGSHSFLTNFAQAKKVFFLKYLSESEICYINQVTKQPSECIINKFFGFPEQTVIELNIL